MLRTCCLRPLDPFQQGICTPSGVPISLLLDGKGQQQGLAGRSNNFSTNFAANVVISVAATGSLQS